MATGEQILGFIKTVLENVNEQLKIKVSAGEAGGPNCRLPTTQFLQTAQRVCSFTGSEADRESDSASFQKAQGGACWFRFLCDHGLWQLRSWSALGTRGTGPGTAAWARPARVACPWSVMAAPTGPKSPSISSGMRRRPGSHETSKR